MDFNKWFIKSDSEKEKLLSSLKLNERLLDSLSLVLKNKPLRKGNSHEKLVDNNNDIYLLGFSTPLEIEKDSLYPLIIYLHGGVGTTRNDKGRNAYEMFRFLADTVDIFLASPSANKFTPWWNKFGLNRILQTIRFMTVLYPIDPDRIFLAGVSDGALGCYAAANSIPGPFAGFIPISGYGGMLPQVGMQIYPSNLKQRQIYSINGEEDHLYPVQYNKEFLNWLKEQGVPVEWKIYPGEKHGFDYRTSETKKLVELINIWKKPFRTNVFWNIVPEVPNLTDNLLSWTVDRDESFHRIQAYWKKDTLIINTTGIRSFSILSGNTENKKMFIKLRTKKPRQLRMEKQNTAQFLNIMQHFCFPGIKDMRVFTIQI
jgi:hypothetical protein